MAEAMLLSRLYADAAKVVVPVLIIDFAADTFVTDPALNSMMSLLLALLMVFGASAVMVRRGLQADRERNPHRYVTAPPEQRPPSWWSRFVEMVFIGFAKEGPVLSPPSAKLVRLLLTVHVPLVLAYFVAEALAGPDLSYWLDWWFVCSAALFTALFVRTQKI
jgi:hypothetical protein